MMLLVHLQIALASLRSTRVRTGLTTLGIVIGIAAITLVLALGEGAKQAVSSHLQEFDKNLIVIRPGTARETPAGPIDFAPLASYAATTLTEQDYTAVQSIKGISAAAPIMLISGSVKTDNLVAPGAPIVATEPPLVDIFNLTARQGQFIDDLTERDTVTIGQQLSIELYGTDQSLGQRLIIRGREHIVVGVLQNIANPLGINGVDINRAAIVNLNAGKSFNQGIAQIQQINVRVENERDIPRVVAEMYQTILKNHSGENDFTVLRGDEASKVTDNYLQVLIGIVSLIASISLVVGGIGIMNIMLVSVAERTREVGIRKSLGATHGHIFWQFIIESLVMSLVGGLIGFALAYALAFAISLELHFTPALTWPIFGIAIGMSALVGVVFGLFPAFRAARKDPIAALRQSH